MTVLLRSISRSMVDGAFPSSFAIALIECLWLRPYSILARSSMVKKQGAERYNYNSISEGVAVSLKSFGYIHALLCVLCYNLHVSFAGTKAR